MFEFFHWVQCLVGLCDADFWPNFWPNFWADFLVGIAIYWFVSRLVTATKRANLDVTVAVAPYARAVGGKMVILDINIGNTGNVPVNTGEAGKLFWDVFLPPGMGARGRGEPDLPVRTIGGRQFSVLQGMTEAPIFPGRSLHVKQEFGFAPPDDRYEIYYQLSTYYGVFPKAPGRFKRAMRSILARRKLNDHSQEYGKAKVVTQSPPSSSQAPS